MRALALTAVAVALAALGIAPACGLDNGLALTPQMGYNSWYDLQCSDAMNESTLRSTADKMVELGLPALGFKYLNLGGFAVPAASSAYLAPQPIVIQSWWLGLPALGKYLNLDDCYVHARLPNGMLVPDPVKFPSGMRALADYVHSKGLLFGVYTARCAETCDRRPASLDHEVVDAHTFAVDWDADYLKEDSCWGCTNQDPIELYTRMSKALNATGKPVLFDMCWGSTQSMPERVPIGNSWRIGPDDGNWHNIVRNIDIDAQLSQYAGPGHWNNPCLLISRNQAGTAMVTETQTRSQFSAYAVLAAPMIISGSLLKMSAHTLETYTNAEVIAVSQDKLGKQGVRVAGGDLAGSIPGGGGGGGNLQPAVLEECVPGDAKQRFPPNKKLPEGYVQSARGWCLNVAECETDIIMIGGCPLHGCCSNCSNMVFTNHSGEFGSEGMCMQMNPARQGALQLGKCSNAPGALEWRFDPDAQTYSVDVGGKELCLADNPDHVFPPPPPSANTTNVWARQLSGGKIALFFFNVGPGAAGAADVTCDEACFRAAGVTPDDRFEVRDVWQHANVGTLHGASWTAKQVPPEGGSAMFVLTPQRDIIGAL